MTPSTRFWDDLHGRIDNTPAARRQVERLRQRAQTPDVSDAGLQVSDGEVYDRALDMVVAQVQALACEERLRRAAEQLQIETRRFWLAVYEHTDLHPDDRLHFDPATTRIHRAGREAHQPQSSTLHDAVGRFREIVRDVLKDPDAAAQKAFLPGYPTWLRAVAREVSEGTLKPRLRQLIEQCLDDDRMARDARRMAEATRLPSWIVEMLEVLGTAREPWTPRTPAH